MRRILLMVPYAIRHPGVGVDELSRKFDVPRDRLIEDLHLLFLCGLPGYGPGDLIDVSMEEDRVYVRMADYFAAPLRLTPAEALELHAQGSAIAALPEMEEADSLRRALTKLGRALGIQGLGEGESLIEVKLEPGAGEHVRTLREAVSRRRRIELEYLSATRGEMTTRKVDPWALFVTRGHSYVVGWDHLSEDERMFRTDRIKSVALLDEDAPVPDDFDPERYKAAFVERGDLRTIFFEISPPAARWFEDYIPVRSSEPLADGWRAVELSSDSDRWAATLVLRLGDQVRSVRPKSVEAEARRLAEAITTRHRTPATA